MAAPRVKNAVGKYRRLFMRRWDDPAFAAMPDSDKLLTLYLECGPQTNRCGYYRLSLAAIHERFRWPLVRVVQPRLGDDDDALEAVPARVARVVAAWGWEFDHTSGVLWQPDFWRLYPPDNSNVLKGALKDLVEVPRCDLFESFATASAQTISPRFAKPLEDGLEDVRRMVYGMVSESGKGNGKGNGQGDRDGNGNGNSVELAQQAPAETKEILERYAKLWQERHHAEPLMNWPRDGAIAKQLVAQLGKPRVLELLDGWFGMADSYADEAGHPFTLFRSSVNRVAAALARAASRGPVSSHGDATARALARRGVAK